MNKDWETINIELELDNIMVRYNLGELPDDKRDKLILKLFSIQRTQLLKEVREKVKEMEYKFDSKRFKHIGTVYDCKETEEYVWFIQSQTVLGILKKLKELEEGKNV